MKRNSLWLFNHSGAKLGTSLRKSPPHRGGVARSAGVVIVLLYTIALNTFAQSDFISDWPALTERLERAYLNDDMAELRSIRASCMRALLAPLPPDKAPLVRYAVAYADWR